MLGLIEARDRLRQLADDCEERARRSRSGNARNLYQLAASECRSALIMHPGRLPETLAAMTAQSMLARWYDGEDVPEFGIAPLQPDRALAHQSAPTAPTRPPHALTARQLAATAGMTERGALKRIVHAFHRGMAGFYRDGRRWFAEREAFDQFRMSSDCGGGDSVRL
jgi:hypothetical protein